MLIKTQEFVDQFNRDLDMLLLNKKTKHSYRVKGSFQLKDIGAPISDIDIEQLGYLNRRFIDIFSSIIARSRGTFKFIRVKTGFAKELFPPWTIDENGECKFNLAKAYEWLKQLEKVKIVSADHIKEIHNIFDKDKLAILDLAKISAILDKYYFKWNLEEFKRGFKIINGHRYDILVEMQRSIPVFKFAYEYKGQFCAVDIAIRDRKYHPKFTTKEIDSLPSHVYRRNFYKLLKSIKWRISEHRRSVYTDFVNQFETQISIINEIELYKKLKPIYVNLADRLLKNITADLKAIDPALEMDQAYNKFKNMINVESFNNIRRIANYIFDLTKYTRSMVYWYRALNDYPVNREKIIELNQQGIDSVFTSITSEQWDEIIRITRRIDGDGLEVHKCLVEISERKKIDLDSVLKTFQSLNTQLIRVDDKYVIFDDVGQIVQSNVSLQAGIYRVLQIST